MPTSCNLLVKSRGDRPGLVRIAGPGDAGLKYIGFSLLNLTQEQPSYSASTGGRELALDVFSGECTIDGRTRAGERFHFDSVGRRTSAFAGPPEMVYLPGESEFTIRANGPTKIGIFDAPSTLAAVPVYIPGERATKLAVGKANWTRDVMTSIGSNVQAQRLLVGETLNPPGNWSSAPPHKHDTRVGTSEVPMEEIYYFQIDPPQGFAMMRVYTAPGDIDPLDVALVVENGDTVLIPRGYHPVVAAPGYKAHYTWGLAGEERRQGAWSDDPRHAWVKNT